MKKAFLLVNLGSPDSPTPKDVKRYLDEFLMDKRVIDVPYLLRAFIVKGIILNTRPKKSAAAYKKVWLKEGSPLIVLTKRLQEKVKNYLDIPVEIAMRYGSPSLKESITKLYNQGIRDLVLLPLYPQFAMATTETILALSEDIRTRFPALNISYIPAFYNQKDYISVLGDSIKSYLADKPHDFLLFSYHGVPERHIRKSDVTKNHCKIDDTCCITPSKAHEFCYRHQCLETTRKVADYLGLKEGFYQTSFQSRLGRDPWLQPYTGDTIAGLPQKNIKRLAVVTPAFVSDCLETLEEIGMEAKHSFLSNGGEAFYVVPCLNDSTPWAKLLAKWGFENSDVVQDIYITENHNL